jgi:hypothetical protein
MGQDRSVNDAAATLAVAAAFVYPVAMPLDMNNPTGYIAIAAGAAWLGFFAYCMWTSRERD